MNNTTAPDSSEQSVRCFVKEGTAYYSVLVIIAFFTVCINFGVIFIMATNCYLQTKRNAFLASLTVSDLLTGLVAIPLHILCSCYHQCMGTLCLAQAICFRFIAISGMLSIFMITVERYIGILYPIRYAVILTKTRTFILISCTWATSIFSALVTYSWLAISNPESANAPGREEKLEHAYFMFAFVSFFILPLVVMVVLYTRMFRAISNARKSATKTLMNTTTIRVKDPQNQSQPDLPENIERRERSRSHSSYEKHMTTEDPQSSNERLRSRRLLSPPDVFHRPSDASLGSEIALGMPTLKDQRDNESAFPYDKNPDMRRASLISKLSDACGTAASKLCMLRKGTYEDHLRQAYVIRERRVLVIFLTMLSFFVFSWLSWYIMLFHIVRMIRVPDIILDCFDILRFSVSFFNPILYTFLKKDFRRVFLRNIRGSRYGQSKGREPKTKMLKS